MVNLWVDSAKTFLELLPRFLLHCVLVKDLKGHHELATKAASLG